MTFFAFYLYELRLRPKSNTNIQCHVRTLVITLNVELRNFLFPPVVYSIVMRRRIYE